MMSMSGVGDPRWSAFFSGAKRDRWHEAVRFGATAAVVTQHCRGCLVYLATPYSREVTDEAGRFQRGQSLEMALYAAHHVALLAGRGITAISPVVLSADAVEAALVLGEWPDRLDPLNAPFWDRWCRPLLSRCDAVVVPDIAGWSRSRGIWAEVTWAITGRAIPVFVYGDAEGEV
jgi:hypothetical protein